MQNWQIAIVPPLLVWCGLYLYALRVERRLRDLERRLDSGPGE